MQAGRQKTYRHSIPHTRSLHALGAKKPTKSKSVINEECISTQTNRNDLIFASLAAYSVILKMEAVRYSKNSVHFYRTTRRDIADDISL